MPRESFRLLTPAENVSTYTFNTGVAKHHFCPNCGVAAFYIPRSDPDKIDVNARCLDGVEPAALEIERFDGRNWEAAIEGHRVALIANQRGIVKGRAGERPHFGGIVYTESAEKVAYFITNADREGFPLLFVQDVSGFMVGPDAEHSGIIRAGARFVEAMATATVPKVRAARSRAGRAGWCR